ncbi:MAG TPA: D-alanine--D-alanine ligase [Bacteroidales bacterium]|nr:D-alanine--D-alanine ligase [Bacteroidales bacterium]
MEIAILSGGDSSEHSVSVKSAAEVEKWLRAAGYSTHLVEIKGINWMVKNGASEIPVNKESFSFKNGKKTVQLDYAWNIIHGKPGENGQIQGYLDMINIPYSSSGHFASSLTFNKYATKTFLKQFDVMTAESVLIRKNKPYNIEYIIDKVGLPCFIKPNNGGSSFGTTKVTQPDKIETAIKASFKEDDEVIIESFVKGTEITCGLIKTRKETIIFPLTEIVPSKEFFDFKAKYKGEADEITPARINEDTAKKCKQLSSEIYDLTFCRGLVRVDFILRGNQLYFLEINTIPGMSKESIVPQQIRAAGMKEEEVLKKVVEDTIR